MESTTFVLFGATGDLAKRKIYPALFNLFLDGKLPQAFSVFGLGRRELSEETFRSNVAQALRSFSRREASDPAIVDRFLSAFSYSVLYIDREADYVKLLQLVEQREAAIGAAPNRMFYLSVGPEFFETIAANIKSSGLGSANGWKRLVIEKPFGHDLQSARDLNAKLSQSFEEDEVYRIDHYLGKPMVQRLEILQQANPLLQALWTNRHIANVQITANETVGVEERAGYYDHVGAVRDMFQNHMLQVLSMLAIHLPDNSTSSDVRLRKKKVMEAVVPLPKENVALQVVRGQYTEGTVQGKPVVGYTSEPGIAATSANDTFIAAKLEIDDYFWRGVPFYIRTGKRMKEKSTRIVIEFKEPLKQPTLGHDDNGKTPNLLVFEISPNEGITLQLNTRDPHQKGEYKPMNISFHTSEQDVPEAYENLIGDALNGDPTFFAHWDEVELAWKWVQPILDAFAENLLPLHTYSAGSYGPAASDELLAKDGFRWRFDADAEEPAAENEQSDSKEGANYAYHANH